LFLRAARPAASALPGKDSESYSEAILQTPQQEAQDLTKDRFSRARNKQAEIATTIRDLNFTPLMRHASSNLISGV